MLRKLAILTTSVIVAAAMLPGHAAYANGGTIITMPNAVATSNGGSTVTCGASATTGWTVEPDGNAGINFSGTTTCDRAVKMTPSPAP